MALINLDPVKCSYVHIPCLPKRPGSHFMAQNGTFKYNSQRGEAIWPIFIHHIPTKPIYVAKISLRALLLGELDWKK